MAKLYKVEMYVVDFRDEYNNIGAILTDAEDALDGVFIRVASTQGKNIPDWNDDIDINKSDASIEVFDAYFK